MNCWTCGHPKISHFDTPGTPKCFGGGQMDCRCAGFREKPMTEKEAQDFLLGLSERDRIQHWLNAILLAYDEKRLVELNFGRTEASALGGYDYQRLEFVIKAKGMS